MLKEKPHYKYGLSLLTSAKATTEIWTDPGEHVTLLPHLENHCRDLRVGKSGESPPIIMVIPGGQRGLCPVGTPVPPLSHGRTPELVRESHRLLCQMDLDPSIVGTGTWPNPFRPVSSPVTWK